MSYRFNLIRVVLVLTFLVTGQATAQPIALDGTTGGWLNPWALVSPAKKGEVGHPAVAYHFLDAGPIVGNVSAPSVALGFNGNCEVGYTHYFIDGPTPVLSTDLDQASAKWNFLSAKGDRPAVSLGAIRRWSSTRDLGTTDLYVVATRIFGLDGGVALLANGGLRSTKAAIFGIAGEAANRKVRPFGTLALVLDKRWTVGAELTGQPGTDTNGSFFVRLIPDRKERWQIILAIAHVEDSVQARAQFASSITHRF